MVKVEVCFKRLNHGSPPLWVNSVWKGELLDFDTDKIFFKVQNK